MRVTNGIPLRVSTAFYRCQRKLCRNAEGTDTLLRAASHHTFSILSNHELCHHTNDVTQH
jgi:hypothetical protein